MRDAFTRRTLLQALTCVGISWLIRGDTHAFQTQLAAAEAMDHLIIGAADLDTGMQWLEQRTGVRLPSAAAIRAEAPATR